MAAEVIFSEDTKRTLAEAFDRDPSTETSPDEIPSLVVGLAVFEGFVNRLDEVREVHALGLTRFDRTPRSVIFLHILMDQDSEALKKVLAAEKQFSSGNFYGRTAVGYFDAPKFTPESMASSLEERTRDSQDGEKYVGMVIFHRN